MFVVFLSDFLVRGYDDKNIAYVAQGKIVEYQFTILTIFAVTLLAAGFVRNKNLEKHLPDVRQTLQVTPRARQLLFLLAVALLGLELHKRLSSVGWSFSEAVHQSLMPRGQREWDLASYSGNFYYAILTIVMPMAGFAFGYLVIFNKGLNRLVPAIGLLVIFGILFTNGSRTPVVVMLAVMTLFILLQQKYLITKAITVIAMVGALAASTSAMYNFRSYGYLEETHNDRTSFELTYHQDDSYYRALFAMDRADQTDQRWDALEFFGSIAVNPVPRALWPGKPVLDEKFFGDFKLSYVTNLYIGEAAAMFGPFWTILVCPAIGLCFYLVLYNSMKLLKMPAGLSAYLIVALYVYMCMRSMQNITFFIYLPVFFIVSLYFVDRPTTKRRRRRHGAYLKVPPQR